MVITDTLSTWSYCNTGSHNPAGLAHFWAIMESAFSGLGVTTEWVEFSKSKALRLRNYREGKPQVLFLGHIDTVFPPDHPFQHPTQTDPDHLNGPGVLDMKGGILVILEVLKQWEASTEKEALGWEVILTSDEEIGSPESGPWLTEHAKHFDLGLVFEPGLPDGSLISARKGSTNLIFSAKGKAAHAGRDFKAGRSAIHAISTVIHRLQNTEDTIFPAGTLINVGTILGGQALNVIAEHAEAGVNIRFDYQDHVSEILGALDVLMAEVGQQYGVELTYTQQL